MNPPLKSGITDWLPPRITLSACVEVAGRWWLVAMCGLLLLAALLLSLQRSQAQELREARLEIALQGIKERLETSLALGFELIDSQQAQALLEDLLSDDPSLLSAEVFDANALSLFNTDRGAIGDRVPSSWLAASAHSQSTGGRGEARSTATASWSVIHENGFTLGMPIRGPFGEIAGHISITSPIPPSPSPWYLLGVTLAGSIGVSVACLLLAIWLLRKLANLRDDAAMELAASRLREIDARMEAGLDALKRNEDSH
ncbi:PDC sensor domain-containing protein [Ottowia thiooxydans]|uniref:Type II secretory pathway pseudopilin PulG n=1 Tax=Ottowia thiooxydans TaxID=219182 RepID=A0ABV2QGE9_9BURK